METIRERLERVTSKSDLEAIYLTGLYEVLEIMSFHGITNLHALLHIGVKTKVRIVRDLQEELTEEALDEPVYEGGE